MVKHSSLCRTFLSMLTLTVILAFGTGCTSLMRGFNGNDLVSNGYPPVTITSNMPLKLAVQFNPMVLSDMIFVNPQTWLAVYGAESQNSPMAVVAYAVTPNKYQWDMLTYSLPDGPVTSQVAFGGQTFSGSTHVLTGQNNHFAGVLGLTPEAAADRQWLVQRYALLEDFRKTKIILEYREPMPASLKELVAGGNIALHLANPEVQAFLKRAEAAFTVDFAFSGTVPKAPWLAQNQGVSQINFVQFLGSLSPVNPFLNELNNSW